MDPQHRWIRTLGPAIPPGHWGEAARSGMGALLALAALGLWAMAPKVDLQLGLYLIAPFGASAVLLFAVPNSPLAQPWSAVVGNCTAALIGVTSCLLLDHDALRIALAVGLSILAMIQLRAVHPPAGAVAMTAAMNPDQISALGYAFVLSPVLLGTALMVAMAHLYARATGRRYPFRQFAEAPRPEAAARHGLGLSELELTEILDRYRQTLNLGVEDLARLIDAAEVQAASQRSGISRVGQIMSRDLVTVGPETRLDMVAAIFQRHGFTSLPVVDTAERLLGVIFQLHLIRPAAGPRDRVARLLNRRRDLRAVDVMDADLPRLTADAPIAAVLPLLAEGRTDAVPVVEGARIVGIVTRTDLIAALAHHTLTAADRP